MRARAYEWPEGLYPLRDWLKRQGVDVDNLKTERQALYLTQRLMSARKVKMPIDRRSPLFPELQKLQGVLRLQHQLPRQAKENRYPGKSLGSFGAASTVRRVSVEDYLAQGGGHDH
ncbi:MULTISPECIES: hypothetical protein [unclassified Mesorhizobium]|uniref:hypothetical protein n=1 Tax=unclassified Mesorhizobium TaxID=325217 RepID=UPI0003D0621E|nr:MULTISPECIES: hypothetical protein [unclassified Mesorhizobium]ESZ07165.1 hypothetical protein X736_10950 [Mesorhizobium sp. L2C089B000]WJI52557.1 hypothetical protein NLY44_07775 [Mesorhizobium sp. C089B]